MRGGRMGFIRFVVSSLDPDSSKRLGILNAAYELQKQGQLSRAEDRALQDLREWFNQNLEKPARFSRSSSKAQHKQPKALSWFKDSSTEHIRRTREVAKLLEAHAIGTQMITVERVGYVVYEDEYQIVAEPFSDTLT